MSPSSLLLLTLASSLTTVFTQLQVTQIYHNPHPGTWLENLAVRPNGQILATRLDVSELYQVTPDPHNPNPTLIYAFPSALGTLGIAELPATPDVYAVLVGNFSLATISSQSGSYSIWRVNMRPSRPIVSKIADIPSAVFPNGMVSLSAAENALLVSDSTLGNVWRFDLTTHAYEVVIDDPLMKKVSPSVGEGVNGIRLHGEYLYFINSFGPFLARVPIYPNGTANGKGNIVAYAPSGEGSLDDFAIDEDGTAYVATGVGNVITKVTEEGVASVIAGNLNSSQIASPTSVAFGRKEWDRWTIYVTTGGGLEAPINGTAVVGAQLVAVKLV
ncbi:putative six-bladed beta-propeller-like protein [Mycena venus]|uniref:Putative six-bladed beta-propeller-like protein n=1 Tax=Mycena venus TaxID=2733690 RepID=A0A8H6YVB6_9AGAR|nr:putative six-bladed beta-propeller-like protein [Mycena venus]